MDVRILLRVPKAMCWAAGQSQLLADLEKAVRGMLTLGKVEPTVKPHKGVLDTSAPLPCTTRIIDRGSYAFAFHPAAQPTGSVDHYTCLADAVDSGWIIDDVEQNRGRCGSSNHGLRTASVRVFIRARVEQ